MVILCHAIFDVVECGKHLEVEYLGLQDIFYQTNDVEWDFDMYLSDYCPQCSLRPCLLEDRAEDIYYVFC